MNGMTIEMCPDIIHCAVPQRVPHNVKIKLYYIEL